MMSANQWFAWATRIASEKHSDWLNAMRAEASYIDNAQEQAQFAFGCFTTVLRMQVFTVKGISFISRVSLILFIMVMSVIGIIMGLKMGTNTETAPYSTLIIALCSAYFMGAILLSRSIRYFTYFAKVGIFMGLVGGYYAVLTGSPINGVPDRWFIALFIEMTAIMVVWHVLSAGLTKLSESAQRTAQ